MVARPKEQRLQEVQPEREELQAAGEQRDKGGPAQGGANQGGANPKKRVRCREKKKTKVR